MQIDELTNEGLKREYKIVVGAADIDKKLDSHLEDLKDKIRLPGFRPGKAPASLLKKLHGKSLIGQVLEDVVKETSQKLFEEKDIKPAVQPKIEDVKYEDESDFEFRIEVEILPTITVPDLTKIKLERLVIKPTDAEIDEALAQLAGQQKRFEAAPKTAKAVDGDVVLIDFFGSIDGVDFEGGTGTDHQLELGSASFIPGFEEQLIGAKAGDDKDINVTFPEAYDSKELAGKDALFKVTVKEVQKPAKIEINDDFAKSLGLEGLDKLKESVGQQLAQELGTLSRAIIKRKLLDQLAEICTFEVPPTMVDIEFNQIWEQIKRDLLQAGEATAEELEGMDGPADPVEHEDYRNIAERRVRLGLFLSEVGQERDVTVGADEVNRAILQEARRYPGQEKEVFDLYTKNESAAAQIRAPLYEEKVCDLIVEGAKVTEKTVDRAALEAAFTALEEEDQAPKAAKKGKAKAKAKAKAKKAPAKKAKAKKTKVK